MNKHSTAYVGLDVHKQFIQVAVIPEGCGEGGTEALEWRTPNTPSKVTALVRKLRKHGERVEICYEAGPTGYGLSRRIAEETGFRCRVIAPSLIPKKAGERIKTDRRDARKLAEYLKAGLLTEVQPPTPEEEARRELCRARTAAKEDEKRAKQKLSKFLLRQDRQYREGKSAWTNKHMVWLERQTFDNLHLQFVFDSLLRAVTQAADRVRELDEALEAAAQEEEVREPVALLKCFRGIRTTTAMSLVSELYDIERFSAPRKLMGFIGLTPSEHSTGGSPKRGGITKAGNGRLRRLLIESAWTCIRTNKAGYRVRKRREGQPGWAVDLAERAQHRLHRKYWKLVHGGKNPNVAVVAIAREFAGFIWAMLLNHKLQVHGVAA